MRCSFTMAQSAFERSFGALRQPQDDTAACKGRFRTFQAADAPINSQNFLRSIFPPETIATIGPGPAFPVNAAASGKAPAPSEMIRAFSAMSRIAFFVS